MHPHRDRERMSQMRVGTVVRPTLVMVMLGLMAVACGGSSGGEGQAPGGSAVAGAACSRDGVVVHVDATNTDLRCGADRTGAKVWIEEKTNSQNQNLQPGIKSSNEIPSVVENIGFDLQVFDPATGRAGAMQIQGVVPPKLPSSDPNAAEIDAMNRYLFQPFGYASTKQGKEDVDPQWAFYLPLGTPVISLVTGTVCDVPKLYSGDFSVRVAPDGITCNGPGNASVLFETEHVINPIVAFGDRVTAGQRVATVSDYRREWAVKGFGIVEIGAFYNLDNNGVPMHACPSRYFAPASAGSLSTALQSVMTAWAAQLGAPGLYTGADVPKIGCFRADVAA